VNALPHPGAYSPLPRMTGRIHGLLAATGALLLAANVAEAAATPPAPRFFNSRVREIDARIAAIDTELKALPEAPSGPKGGTLGYHSFQQLGAHADIRATVDLGREFPIDAVVMVPANVVDGIGEGGGSGFRAASASKARGKKPSRRRTSSPISPPGLFRIRAAVPPSSGDGARWDTSSGSPPPPCGNGRATSAGSSPSVNSWSIPGDATSSRARRSPSPTA